MTILLKFCAGKGCKPKSISFFSPAMWNKRLDCERFCSQCCKKVNKKNNAKRGRL